jgi:hypothetical protein
MTPSSETWWGLSRRDLPYFLGITALLYCIVSIPIIETVIAYNRSIEVKILRAESICAYKKSGRNAPHVFFECNSGHEVPEDRRHTIGAAKRLTLEMPLGDQTIQKFADVLPFRDERIENSGQLTVTPIKHEDDRIRIVQADDVRYSLKFLFVVMMLSPMFTWMITMCVRRETQPIDAAKAS